MPKAVQFDQYGGIDVLQVRDLPMPTPGPDDVVIQVKATAVNPGEAAIRRGDLDAMYPTTFPSGEGTDLAGVVDAVGSSVTTFAVGDEVLGWTWDRASHAEFCKVPANQLIAKPAELSWEVAGTLGVAATTAFAAVREVSAGPGDAVAVSAAAGGVGVITVQLLIHRGASVIAIASPDNHEWLRSKGATPIAYGDGLEDALREAKPDAFIDLFGPEYVQLAVDLGIDKDRIETIISFELAGKLGTKAAGSADATTTEVLSEMAGLMASGVIEVPIADTFPLDRVRDAFTELEKHHTRGKIVLIP